ncbi:MAG: DNA mismatch repair protein MutS [Clostridia bacterium]|nr:DNA mismatch repair protein MutS [Clostridia bacterium]
MMDQYLKTKEKYSDCILFFRLGDFYEMFFEDALIASKDLEITLTGRNCGLNEKAPMCGIPYHSADNYIAKLIHKGHKVAICEQVEDPATAKGIVKREVIRIITPGTVTEDNLIDEKVNNYIMSVYKEGSCFGIASCDITTGEFQTTQITFGDTISKVIDEIAKFKPAEIITTGEIAENAAFYQLLKDKMGIYVSVFDDGKFDKENAKKLLKDKTVNINFKDYDIWLNASGGLLEYLTETRKTPLDHINEINVYDFDRYMTLDVIARRNLELAENLREGKKKGTLLWILDKTATSMGARTLRKWVMQPLLNIQSINERLEGVESLKEKYMVRMELFELLKAVYDMERLTGKIVMENANCRDLIALKTSIGQLPHIKNLIKDDKSAIIHYIANDIDQLEDIYELIDNAIIEQPPFTIKEGGIIKDGYNQEIDQLKLASRNGKQWILDLEKQEREKTGIKNLKIGYNKVFGYYLDVTKSYYDMVPENYIRKQTLANSERYITEQLKEMETTILGAEEKLVRLEYSTFLEIREHLAKNGDRLQRTAKAICVLDALCSLAEVADRENYVKPAVDDSTVIDIKDGRHPVVEKMPNCDEFIPNDTYLDCDEFRTSVITGPNMAGKSTYMRQTALIVLMAQMGSFIPASSARIGLVDKIFTRIGAADDLAGGQSTFMLEMSEVASIIKNTTERSLLILDEIGRGTSTFDGLSIAWAVIEFLAKNRAVRTLFSTHYHELTELEGREPGVKNYCITAEKQGNEVTFLRKVIRGGADESFGIQVAYLAGIPDEIIQRATYLLNELEKNDIGKRNRIKNQPIDGQLNFTEFSNKNKKEEAVIKLIKDMKIQEMTPLEALNKLYELKNQLE